MPKEGNSSLHSLLLDPEPTLPAGVVHGECPTDGHVPGSQEQTVLPLFPRTESVQSSRTKQRCFLVGWVIHPVSNRGEKLATGQ